MQSTPPPLPGHGRQTERERAGGRQEGIVGLSADPPLPPATVTGPSLLCTRDGEKASPGPQEDVVFTNTTEQ
jgi:hypothetical protein